MTIATLQPDEAASKDTYIDAGATQTHNYGVSQQLRTQGPAATRRALIQFDLSGIPAGSVINSATLTLVCFAGGTGVNVGIHRALTDWFEGDADGAAPSGDGSSWANRNNNGPVAWGAAGGQAGTDYASSAVDTVSVAGAASYDWELTTEVDDMVNNAVTNRGWWLVQASGVGRDFRSSNYGTVAERPKLVIDYTLPDDFLSGSAAGEATVTGTLRARGYLSGSAVGEASVNGNLTSNLLSGSTTGQATVTGRLTGRGRIAGQSAGVATTNGDLLGRGLLHGATSGQATASGTGTLAGILRGSAAGIATVTGTGVAYARHVARPRLRNPAPILEITDGVETLNLLDPRAIAVCRWRPAIAQYKNGGQWSDSPQAHGRRLKLRRFANAIEVFEFDTSGKDQDEVAAHLRALMRFLEAAADYWTSNWATRPIYVRARSAYEQHIRHTIVHAASVPELADVFDQTFFTARGRPVLGELTLRLERGAWLENPPGLGTCVAISSIRNWTVTGWASSDTGGGGGGGGDAVSGDVLAMVQAANGDILIGTNDAATIYRSSDEGQTWAEVTNLGSSSDSVNALTKDNVGNLYAAVSGGGSAQGIWRSTNHGASWTRVKTHPRGAGYGYLDITYIRAIGRLVAVGYGVTSHLQSPIAISGDGVTWSEIPYSSYNYDVMAVDAPPDPVLPTLYPGDTITGVSAYFGTDTFYTIGGRAGFSSAGNYAVSTASGQMGNGGLDMAAFLIQDAQGSFRQRALWAVKSHLNTADTEIWQWPVAATGPYNFAKIATITGELFTALYVDTTPGYASAQRTIWAGANGKIYVSYNSGYTWALATSAPSNQVRCFLRTASGVMLAGCDNAEIFLFSGGSGGEGGGGGGSEGGESEAGGSEVVNSQPLGRAATCADEVYVANKSSFSNVTHVLYYDGSTYSELQFATEPPYGLLGDPPASGNILYCGIRTSDANVPSGTFSSLIFDLTQIAEDMTIVWEYWDGNSWETLTVQDNTSAFRVLGVKSVHWAIPTDWATTSVNSITGFWVRARVSAVGSASVGPIHANRYIYTANLPYVEIAESEIGGEIPALAQALWSNRGDNPNGSPDMEVHRLLVGLRSVERGQNFDAYLNLSDKQVPFGVTLTALEGSFEDSVLAPTARRYSVSYSSGGDLNAWADLVRVSLATTIARDYYGDFRVFLRGYIATGDADDWKFRLALGFGSGGVISYSREQFGKPAQVNFRLFDMGSIHIPNASLANFVSDEMSITIQGYATAVNVAAKLYDLILLPLDEWAGDFVHTNLSNSNIPSGVEGGDALDIDSVSNPKVPLAAYNRLESGLVKAIYQPIANGEAVLQVGQRQRLWFLAAQYAFASNSWGADPTVTGSVRVNKVQQYLGLRGAG